MPIVKFDFEDKTTNILVFNTDDILYITYVGPRRFWKVAYLTIYLRNGKVIKKSGRHERFVNESIGLLRGLK